MHIIIFYGWVPPKKHDVDISLDDRRTGCGQHQGLMALILDHRPMFVRFENNVLKNVPFLTLYHVHL